MAAAINASWAFISHVRWRWRSLHNNQASSSWPRYNAADVEAGVYVCTFYLILYAAIGTRVVKRYWRKDRNPKGLFYELLLAAFFFVILHSLHELNVVVKRERESDLWSLMVDPLARLGSPPFLSMMTMDDDNRCQPSFLLPPTTHKLLIESGGFRKGNSFMPLH